MLTTFLATAKAVRGFSRRSQRVLKLWLATAAAGTAGLQTAAAQAQTFADVTIEAGIFGNNSSWGHAWFDFDNDGNVDLLSHAHLQDVLPSVSQLWRNNGDGTFTDVTGGSEFRNITGDTHGTVIGDYNGDGLDDFYVVNGTLKVDPLEHNSLWRNNGDGTVTRLNDTLPDEDPILGIGARGRGAYAFDFNRDGKLDIFSTSFHRGCRQEPCDRGNMLLENTGDFAFVEVGEAYGIARRSIENRPGAWSDFNGDRIVDVFLGTPCALFAGQADGSFVDVTFAAGIDTASECTAAVFGDYDGDGEVDLFVSRGFNLPATDLLYRNNGDGTFTDVSAAAGLTASLISRGANWGDYDNDGDLDLYVVTFNNAAHPNRLYRNNGDGTFTDVAVEEGAGGQVAGGGAAGTFVDYDNNGSLDIFLSNGEANTVGPYVLLKNAGNASHWLKVNLIGRVSNPDGLMTWMRAETATATVERLHTGPQSFLSQSALPVHFGLGDQAAVDRLFVEWPSGVKQLFRNLAADQTVTLVEGRSIWAGAPTFSAPGIYIWQGSAESGWKILWMSDGTPRQFSGRITITDGTFSSVLPNRHEGDETVSWTSTTIDFAATESGYFDSLDFSVQGSRPQITFDLTIDGVAEAGSVFIGKYNIKPAVLPLTLGR